MWVARCGLRGSDLFQHIPLMIKHRILEILGLDQHLSLLVTSLKMSLQCGTFSRLGGLGVVANQSVFYLSVGEVEVPDLKSFLSVPCNYQNKMEVYLKNNNSLGFWFTILYIIS